MAEPFSATLKREIPITDYAARLGFTLVRKGRYYSLKEHDSVIIDTEKNCFWRNSRFSRGFTGGAGSVIDFAIEFGGVSDAREAMRELSNLYGIHRETDRPQNVSRQPQTAQAPRRERKAQTGELALPERAGNNNAVFRYLIHERQIQRSVIRYFLARDLLYQDVRHNCVFHTDTFGCVRSTGDTRFVADVEGSNYDECFYFRGSNAAKKLIVAESVIDIMSVMSYMTLRGQKYTDYCYLALSGTNKLESVFHHLRQEGKNIDGVYLCLDNDEAGRKASGLIRETVERDFPDVGVTPAFAPGGKDWNDYIKTYTAEREARTHGEDERQEEPEPEKPHTFTVSKFVDDMVSGGGLAQRYVAVDENGVIAGTLTFQTDTADRPYVSFIETEADYRRQGVATLLLQTLQRDVYPTEISFGMTTPDGTALLSGITEERENPAGVAAREEYGRLSGELEALQTHLDELNAQADSMDADSPELEAILPELREAGERWQTVYDTLRDFQNNLDENSTKMSYRYVKLPEWEEQKERRNHMPDLSTYPIESVAFIDHMMNPERQGSGGVYRGSSLFRGLMEQFAKERNAEHSAQPVTELYTAYDRHYNRANLANAGRGYSILHNPNFREGNADESRGLELVYTLRGIPDYPATEEAQRREAERIFNRLNDGTPHPTDYYGVSLMVGDVVVFHDDFSFAPEDFHAYRVESFGFSQADHLITPEMVAKIRMGIDVREEAQLWDKIMPFFLENGITIDGSRAAFLAREFDPVFRMADIRGIIARSQAEINETFQTHNGHELLLTEPLREKVNDLIREYAGNEHPEIEDWKAAFKGELDEAFQDAYSLHGEAANIAAILEDGEVWTAPDGNVLAGITLTQAGQEALAAELDRAAFSADTGEINPVLDNPDGLNGHISATLQRWIDEGRERYVTARERLAVMDYPCYVVDRWEDSGDSFILGQSVDDPHFYYVRATTGDTTREYEYDHRPERLEAFERHLDQLSAEDIDRHEAEYGADGYRAFPGDAPQPPIGVVQERYESTQNMEPGYINRIAIVQEADGYHNHFLYDEDKGKGAAGTGPFRTLADARQDVLAHFTDATQVRYYTRETQGEDYFFHIEANPRPAGENDTFFLQAYRDLGNGRSEPGEVLFLGTYDQCRELMGRAEQRRLETGTITPEEVRQMAQERRTITVQAASLSNIPGYVVMSQFDRDRADAGETVFLGLSENYREGGVYDNSDNSLIRISDNPKMFQFFDAGEGWTLTQQAMLDNGAFTREDYAEYAAIRESLAGRFPYMPSKQFAGVPFSMNWDSRTHGEDEIAVVLPLSKPVNEELSAKTHFVRLTAPGELYSMPLFVGTETECRNVVQNLQDGRITLSEARTFGEDEAYMSARALQSIRRDMQDGTLAVAVESTEDYINPEIFPARGGLRNVDVQNPDGTFGEPWQEERFRLVKLNTLTGTMEPLDLRVFNTREEALAAVREDNTLQETAYDDLVYEAQDRQSDFQELVNTAMLAAGYERDPYADTLSYNGEGGGQPLQFEGGYTEAYAWLDGVYFEDERDEAVERILHPERYEAQIREEALQELVAGYEGRAENAGISLPDTLVEKMRRDMYRDFTNYGSITPQLREAWSRTFAENVALYEQDNEDRPQGDISRIAGISFREMGDFRVKPDLTNTVEGDLLFLYPGQDRAHDALTQAHLETFDTEYGEYKKLTIDGQTGNFAYLKTGNGQTLYDHAIEFATFAGHARRILDSQTLSDDRQFAELVLAETGLNAQHRDELLSSLKSLMLQHGEYEIRNAETYERLEGAVSRLTAAEHYIYTRAGAEIPDTLTEHFNGLVAEKRLEFTEREEFTMPENQYGTMSDPRLDDTLTAEQWYTNARNGYIDNPETLDAVRDILQNEARIAGERGETEKAQERAEQAERVGYMAAGERAEADPNIDTSLYNVERMKLDFMDGIGGLDEVEFSDGLFLSASVDRGQVLVSIRDSSDPERGEGTGASTMTLDEFKAMNQRDFDSFVGQVYSMGMEYTEPEREPERDIEYQVGQSFYVDGRRHEITRMDDWNVYLMDRTVQNPELRTVSRGDFEALLRQDERNVTGNFEWAGEPQPEQPTPTEQQPEQAAPPQEPQTPPTPPQGDGLTHGEDENPRDRLSRQLMEGVTGVMNSDSFKAWLDTSSRIFTNGYSFRNAMLIFLQKPEASYCMGYEAWKDYGRNVTKGATGAKIFVPVLAYEKQDGALFRMIKGSLEKQLKENPAVNPAAYRVGTSKLEFTLSQSGLWGLKVNGREQGNFHNETEVKRFIQSNILGKVPMYFNVGTVFDVKDTAAPEFLWVKKGFTKDEMVRDENGKAIKNKRGEYKIKNTPERQAKFQTSLGTEIKEQDPKKMAVLLEALKAVAERNGVPVREVEKDSDEALKGGAKGYFDRSENAITLDSALQPTEKVATLLHEMGHADLHGDLEKLAQEMGEKVPRGMREVQAEAVAYATAQQFGIATDTSSFAYIAAYSKGVEAQDLSKSLDVIFRETKKLTAEIRAELDMRGLNLDLSDKAKEPLLEDTKKGLAASYMKRLVAAEDVNRDVLSELPKTAEQYKGNRELLDNLAQQRQAAEVQGGVIATGKSFCEALLKSTDRAEQESLVAALDGAMKQIETANTRLEVLSAGFMSLCAEQNPGRYENFNQNPERVVAELKEAFPAKFEGLSPAQVSYIAQSDFVSRNLAPLLREDTSGEKFAQAVTDRAKAIPQIAAKNGTFVEVSMCEQWTEKPIVKNGALLHPNVANSIIKQGEAAVMKLKNEAEKQGDYFPYNKCRLTVFTLDNGTLNAHHTRVDIGDGYQKSLTDFLHKEIGADSNVAKAFDSAIREKGAKEKMLFNEPVQTEPEKEVSAAAEAAKEAGKEQGQDKTVTLEEAKARIAEEKAKEPEPEGENTVDDKNKHKGNKGKEDR